MTTANATTAIWCEWIKIILFFGQISKKYFLMCHRILVISLWVPWDEKGWKSLPYASNCLEVSPGLSSLVLGLIIYKTHDSRAIMILILYLIKLRLREIRLETWVSRRSMWASYLLIFHFLQRLERKEIFLNEHTLGSGLKK